MTVRELRQLLFNIDDQESNVVLEVVTKKENGLTYSVEAEIDKIVSESEFRTRILATSTDLQDNNE